jgi:hypothetical protein
MQVRGGCRSLAGLTGAGASVKSLGVDQRSGAGKLWWSLLLRALYGWPSSVASLPDSRG